MIFKHIYIIKRNLLNELLSLTNVRYNNQLPLQSCRYNVLVVFNKIAKSNKQTSLKRIRQIEAYIWVEIDSDMYNNSLFPLQI